MRTEYLSEESVDSYVKEFADKEQPSACVWKPNPAADKTNCQTSRFTKTILKPDQ